MAQNKIPLTVELLKQLLHYNSETGKFTWLIPQGRCRAGTVAGTRSQGYIKIKVGGHLVRANRLAWFYMTGEWPKKLVDHKNTIRSDNSWSNLREATPTENALNKSAYNCNLSGFKGVFFYAPTNKWRAAIRVNGKYRHLGYYDTAKEAGGAYAKAAHEHHGEFANTNWRSP